MVVVVNIYYTFVSVRIRTLVELRVDGGMAKLDCVGRWRSCARPGTTRVDLYDGSEDSTGRTVALTGDLTARLMTLSVFCVWQ